MEKGEGSNKITDQVKRVINLKKGKILHLENLHLDNLHLDNLHNLIGKYRQDTD